MGIQTFQVIGSEVLTWYIYFALPEVFYKPIKIISLGLILYTLPAPGWNPHLSALFHLWLCLYFWFKCCSTESIEYAAPGGAGYSVTVPCNCHISSFGSNILEVQSFLIPAVSDIKDQKITQEIRTPRASPSNANSSGVSLADTHTCWLLGFTYTFGSLSSLLD